MSTFGPQIEVAIARVRADIALLHGELVRNDLVVWTGGNVSGRVPGLAVSAVLAESAVLAVSARPFWRKVT